MRISSRVKIFHSHFLRRLFQGSNICQVDGRPFAKGKEFGRHSKSQNASTIYALKSFVAVGTKEYRPESRSSGGRWWLLSKIFSACSFRLRYRGAVNTEDIGRESGHTLQHSSMTISSSTCQSLPHTALPIRKPNRPPRFPPELTTD